MGMNRAVLFLLAVSPVLLAAPGHSADLAVDLKNDASMAVSVPVGADNGVTSESDFEVTADGFAVTIFPGGDVYEKRFWSQPLSQEVFDRIKVGMRARRVTLDNAAHINLRVEGEARKAEYRAKWQAAKREAARREIDELGQKKSSLDERRDALDGRIAAAEKALVDEESRLDWLTGSEEQDIDRSLSNIQDYADRRDELQEQRNAVSGKSPYPRAEISRLTAEIKRLNDRIASERESVRTSQDRKRTARTDFLGRKKDWQNLVADRRALDAEIQALERRIRELSGAFR